MALPKVDINVTNGNLGGVIPTGDGIMGFVVSGIAISGKLDLNTAYPINALEDAVGLGIDADYDTDNGVSAYHHIKEFYDKAGQGAKLWIMVVSHATTMEDICDKSNDIAKKLLEASGGEIKVLGITRDAPASYSPAVTKGLDDDVYNAVLKAQALAEEFTEVSLDGNGSTNGEYRPVRVVIEGRDYQGNPSNAHNFRENTDNRVSVLLGSSITKTNYKGASVGLLLGGLASVPVQRNIGRIKSGDLGIAEAYLSDGTKIEDNTLANLGALHDKGYIVMRQYQGKSGYYFSDNPTCTALTDDYSDLARGRVIDKCIRLANAVFTDELLDEVEVDEDGKMNPALIKSYEGLIENVIGTQMVSVGELSEFTATVNPNQDVLTTNRINITLKATPVAYAKAIAIDLGF